MVSLRTRACYDQGTVNVSWEDWEGSLNSNQWNLVGPPGSDGSRISPGSTNRTSAFSSGVHGRHFTQREEVGQKCRDTYVKEVVHGPGSWNKGNVVEKRGNGQGHLGKDLGCCMLEV